MGNFIEIKKSTLGRKSKMAHLAYMGDAVVGENCNIGCGVVFCNYNGKTKQKCILGNNVFVGSNANLIAPVNIGDNVYIAGGSTINEDIKTGEFSIARARQTTKTNFK
ncbi:MAG: bifunctional UDP-N-acetylglucosamine diphosphorylase/glucosamine-1-phosphate N-acetyltransferase GlmU, partial [Clostridia bacterium]|nr:bifunctional UDP-N-acetylglucosamine diphosphorylase/glucosamine-1-phosphate N-acetyltransferase GlmU [Clostridia bacterium]